MKLSAPDQNDATLLWIRFQQGDELAFAEIYRTYIQTVYSYAKRYTKDEALIEDTLHNLFIYLWQNRAKLSVPLSIKFYLFSAVKRSILKDVLTHRETLSQQYLTPAHEKQTAVYSVEAQYIEHQNEEELNSLLKNAFGLLSGNQRQAIELKYYNNLSCQEISGIMGLNPDNVYKLISRGISILKKNVRQDIYSFLVLFLLPF